MSKVKMSDKRFVNATKEGRLYIKTDDFFKQKKVKQILTKLKGSPIIKEIEKSHSQLSK